MPRQYRTGFRDEMVRRMLAGELVSQLVSESKVPMQTLHRWKHQALVGASLAEGVHSAESAALRTARKRIKVLEQKLQLVKDASKIYDSLAVMDPKEYRCVAVELVSRGHADRNATRAAGVARSSFIKRVKPSPPTDRAIRRLLRKSCFRQNSR
jgi:transposase-like protein